MYEYKATIIRHVDADTTHVDIDLGFDQSVKKTIRWAGINAPERGTDAGKAALASLNERLPAGSICLLHTIKDRKEKYGRYLGRFIDSDGTDLNNWLVEQGHAVAYMEVNAKA